MARVRTLSPAELDDYLCTAGRRRWGWGEVDCFLFVADWVERVTGVDCAGEYRGAYASEREARRLIKLNAGPVAFAGALLARAGYVETAGPQAGDVALVRVAFGCGVSPSRNLVFPGMTEKASAPQRRVVFGPVGAILRRPGFWAVKPSDAPGLVFANFPVIQAWTLPHD